MNRGPIDMLIDWLRRRRWPMRSVQGVRAGGVVEQLMFAGGWALALVAGILLAWQVACWVAATQGAARPMQRTGDHTSGAVEQ